MSWHHLLDYSWANSSYLGLRILQLTFCGFSRYIKIFSTIMQIRMCGVSNYVIPDEAYGYKYINNHSSINIIAQTIFTLNQSSPACGKCVFMGWGLIFMRSCSHKGDRLIHVSFSILTSAVQKVYVEKI